MSDKLLSKEIAEKFLMTEDIALHEYTSVEDSAAESLSKHRGGLSIDTSFEMSDTARESLSNYQDDINEEEPKIFLGLEEED